MSRSRKEEDKHWSWVTNCNPLEVTDDNVRTAYRINVSRCETKNHQRNCKQNPFCLYKLGEDRWSREKDSSYSQYDDPEKERRKPGSYVGLKNLGATCYVNSLLQLWFHNPNFRKAIFKWQPSHESIPDAGSQDCIADQDESLVYNLQKVFALMQNGNQRSCDPTNFITCLRLDTSVQQDAQEFSKLFLSKLESILSYQSEKDVRDLIKDNFCGEYLYVTRCTKCLKESKCPSKFYELTLNIKGNKTIQDCLNEYLKKEILDGDNKYSCANCGDKQDAERFISIKELPPVLNLQLMRFYYDINTDQKRKLSSAIQFTEKLNMSELCENIGDGLEYTLSAVLYHGGNSANSGHYVAHICDSETGTWYKFNDESVEKIDNKKLKFTIEDEYEDAKKNKTQKNLPKGWYQSKSAYMLVYTRSETDQNGSEKPPADNEPTLPSHLENFVKENNEQFENWIVETKLSNMDSVGKSTTQYDEMVSSITMLPADSDTEDFDAVPTSWLQQWFINPDMDNAIDNRKFVCQHGKLDPNEVSNIKYINSEMAESLFCRYGGSPRLRYCEFKCKACVMNKCFDMRLKNKIAEDRKFVLSKLKTLKELEVGYWVCRTSMRSWNILARRMWENAPLREKCQKLLNDVQETPSENHIVTNCENQNVANSTEPGSLGSMENGTVPKAQTFNNEFQNFILARNQGPRFALDTIPDDPNLSDTTDMKLTLDEKQKVPEVKNNNQCSAEVVQVNGKDEFHSRPVKRKRDNDDDDSSNPDTQFNEDLLCQHGFLSIEETKRRLVSEEIWRIFKKYFPYTKEFTDKTQPCEECKSLASEDEVAKSMYRTEAIHQKEYLGELYLDRNRPQLHVERNEPGSIFYVVNKEFISSWRKFIREAGKKEPPLSIKINSALLCADHGGFLYDLNNEIPDALVLTTEDEWKRLSHLYPTDNSIAVTLLEDGQVISQPAVCVPCMSVRMETELKARLCYTNAKIYIKLLNEEREETQANSMTNGTDENVPPKRKKYDNHNGINGAQNNVRGPRGEFGPENNCAGLNGDICGNGAAAGTNGCASAAEVRAACEKNGPDSISADECMTLVMTCDEEPMKCDAASDDEAGAHRMSNGDVNGKVSPAHSSNGKASPAHSSNGKASPAHSSNGKASPAHSSNGNVSSASESVPVRRSNRSRRGNKTVEITVSSSLTLKEVKKKSPVEDADSDTPPFECDAADSRKRPSRPELWTKNTKKFARNSKESKPSPKVTCAHGIESRVCAAAHLTPDEIQDFFDLLHENKDCASQNAFALLYMTPYPPDPTRKRKPKITAKKERINVQYTVQRADNTRVVVCAQSFSSITGMGRHRLNAAAVHFYQEGYAKPENRGGSRQTQKQKETHESIVNFVKKSGFSESHYGRVKFKGDYLSYELNINKLWSAWLNERQATNKPVCQYDTFNNIMKRHFNLGGTNVGSNYASTEPIEESTEAEPAEPGTELSVDEICANTFYEILKEAEDTAKAACVSSGR